MVPPHDPWAREPDVVRRLEEARRAQERVLGELERAREEATLGGGPAPDVDEAMRHARACAEESLRGIDAARRAVARSWGARPG